MNRNVYILAVVALLAYACTGVKVEEDPTGTVKVTCTADWSQVSATPSYVFDFAAARTLKSVHYYEDGIYTNQGDEDQFQMEPGEYETLFLSCTPQDAYRIENKDSFLQSELESLRVLSASISMMTPEEFAAQFGDFSPLIVRRYDTLPRPQAAPLYLASVRASIQANGEVQNLTFQPQPIHQQVSFRITIIPSDETVAPTRVVANITGTPYRVQMLSGHVDTGHMGQTFVEFQHVEGNDWECSVQLLGIMSPEDPELITGPGIMHLRVEYGTIVPNGVNRDLNLKPYLDAQPLLRYTDEGDYYKSVATQARFVVSEPLYLTASDTEHGGEEPVSPWKDPEDGDVHDILDGYDDEGNA